MQTEPQSAAPRVSLQDIRDLVQSRPGLKRDEVYQALVFKDGSNKKKVADLISYMINDKQLTQVEEDGAKFLLPGARIKPAKAAAKQAPVTPEQKGAAEARFMRTGSDEPIANDDENTLEVPLPMPSAFRCALFSDGVMVIDVPDHGSIQLSKDETMELFTYLDGIGSYAREELGL